MRPKMIPPMPESGQSEYNRFRHFAKALLAVPKAEIPTAEEALSKLEDEKQQIDANIAAVDRELKKRKAAKTPPTRNSSGG
jgi:hypothetical protein